MSIVILGGNECMERRYKDLCQSYRCQSKVARACLRLNCY